MVGAGCSPVNECGSGCQCRPCIFGRRDCLAAEKAARENGSVIVLDRGKAQVLDAEYPRMTER